MDDAANFQAMEYMRILAEFLRAIAWPLAIIIIFFGFRPEFRKILGNLKKANIASISMEFQNSDPTLDTRKFEFMDGMETPYLKALRENAEKHLDYIKEDQRDSYLMYGLVHNYACLVFERIHRRIFRTQMAALRSLKSEGGVISVDRASFYFKAMKKHYNHYENISFEQWSQFLVNSELVAIEEDTIRLTDVGNDFVDYSRSIPDTMIPVV